LLRLQAGVSEPASFNVHARWAIEDLTAPS